MGRTKCFNRNDVLDCAIQSFWEHGYSGTSLSDLEKATGVNKSGLYSEFKDKDDIFLESIKRFGETSPVLAILSTKPLGLKNIEVFLRSSQKCSGQKGCFLANTLRDYAVMPEEVKKVLNKNWSQVREGLAQNLLQAGLKSPLPLTNLIMTFSLGLNLKLNAVEVQSIDDEINSFLKMLKSYIA